MFGQMLLIVPGRWGWKTASTLWEKLDVAVRTGGKQHFISVGCWRPVRGCGGSPAIDGWQTPPQRRVSRGLGRGAEAKTKNIFAQGDSCYAEEPVIKFTSLRIFSKWLVMFSSRSLTPEPREPTARNIFLMLSTWACGVFSRREAEFSNCWGKWARYTAHWISEPDGSLMSPPSVGPFGRLALLQVQKVRVEEGPRGLWSTRGQELNRATVVEN